MFRMKQDIPFLSCFDDLQMGEAQAVVESVRSAQGMPRQPSSVPGEAIARKHQSRGRATAQWQSTFCARKRSQIQSRASPGRAVKDSGRSALRERSYLVAWFTQH